MGWQALTPPAWWQWALVATTPPALVGLALLRDGRARNACAVVMALSWLTLILTLDWSFA